MIKFYHNKPIYWHTITSLNYEQCLKVIVVVNNREGE